MSKEGVMRAFLNTVLFIVFVGCNRVLDVPRKEVTAIEPGASEGIEKVENKMRSETSFQIRVPSDRNHYVLVRLNADRLNQYDMSKEDVMKALQVSLLVGFEKYPPTDVVFFPSLDRLELNKYENLLLKHDETGNVVIKLKDVATLEFFESSE